MTLLKKPVLPGRLRRGELLTLRVKPGPPSSQELAHWRSLAEKATPGPWTWAEDKWNAAMKKNSRSRYVYFLQGRKLGGVRPGQEFSEFDYHDVMHLRWFEVKGTSLFNVVPSSSDQEFIAEARTALPQLLDYVKSLEAEVARLKGAGNWST
jgi:hypothetical protein